MLLKLYPCRICSKISILFVSMLLLFISCDENIGHGDKRLKLQSLDLSGAQYLTIVGDATKADAGKPGLFKIDEGGNMSAVMLTCTEESDGSVTETRTDIEVIPRYICSLTNDYTLMLDCRFIEDGQDIGMQQYYEPTAFYFNVLVRNSDGKIFYVPEAAEKQYSLYRDDCIWACTKDKAGNVYFVAGGYVGELISAGNDMSIRQCGSLNIDMSNFDFRLYVDSRLYVFDNGTIAYCFAGTCTFLYPNGGFESIGESRSEEFGTDSYALALDDGIKLITVKNEPGYPNPNFAIEWNDVEVGAVRGETKIVGPVASISSGTKWNDNFSSPDCLLWAWGMKVTGRGTMADVYDFPDKYVLGRTLLLDKSTLKFSELNRDVYYNIIQPREDNMYKGRVWSVSDSGASWFDPKSFEYGSIKYNLPQDYVFTESFTDIPQGKIIMIGINPNNGNGIRADIEMESGRFSIKETAAAESGNNNIIALIPMN